MENNIGQEKTIGGFSRWNLAHFTMNDFIEELVHEARSESSEESKNPGGVIHSLWQICRLHHCNWLM
jgi:hypothetical protein